MTKFVMTQALYSDTGELLIPEGADLSVATRNVCASDIVGAYEADTWIDQSVLSDLVAARMANAVLSKEDIEACNIPRAWLLFGCCIDVFREEGEDWRTAYEAYVSRIFQREAAELSVLRQLRDRRIGVRR